MKDEVSQLRRELAKANKKIDLLLKRVAKLESENEDLRAENLELREKIARLELDSSASSKPPSSDFFKDAEKKAKQSKNKGKADRKKRKHVKGKKAPKPARTTKDEYVDKTITLDISHCPHSGISLLNDKPLQEEVFEHCELQENPVSILRYILRGRYCDECKRYHFPHKPHGGRSFGPRLESLIGYLKPQISTQNLVHFIEEVFHFPTGKSTIQSAVDRVSTALNTPYQEAKESVKSWSVAFVDETGWKLKGSLVWAWMFCCSTLAVTVLRHDRSSKALFDVLGEVFGGALVSDFYSAYVKYACPRQQFCLAHLIRTLLGIGKSPIPKAAAFGDYVVTSLQGIFILFHRRHELSPQYYQRRIREEKKALFAYLEHFDPPNKDSRRIKKRMLKHWPALFRFLERPDLYHATNNHSERMIRFIVLIRKMTLGSQSEKGLRWIERASTCTQTLRLQGRNVFDFYKQAMYSFYQGGEYPSLLPEAVQSAHTDLSTENSRMAA